MENAVKEALGIGLWLPDIAFPAVKALEIFMRAVIPMASAYQSGEWKPGGQLGDTMGIPRDQQGKQETSSTPFGMLDVAVPPMPPPGVHKGAGRHRAADGCDDEPSRKGTVRSLKSRTRIPRACCRRQTQRT